MAFGPESNNPRERRAYAHAIIKRYNQGNASLSEAQSAADRASQTRKGRASNFEAAIGPVFINSVSKDFEGDTTILFGLSSGLKQRVDRLYHNRHSFTYSANAALSREGTSESYPDLGSTRTVSELRELGFMVIVSESRNPNIIVSEPTHSSGSATFFNGVPLKSEHLEALA